MRILSPTSNVPKSAPSDGTRSSGGTTNQGAATNPMTPSIVVPISNIPTVVLDTDVVTGHMAARLCISFLGHILFLKNQVPFPIVQLANMPTKDNVTRVTKKRHELLNSFDTLGSHLYTTFVGLSTALALRGSQAKLNAGPNGPPHHGKRGVSRAFFAVMLGPTIGSAKSRVVVGIDGLETKVWGLGRGDVAARDVSEEGDYGSTESESDPDDEGERNEDEVGEDSDEEGWRGSESDDDASPSPSRSPSPAPSDSEPPVPVPSLLPSPTSQRQADDPDTIRAAERLLSRTLASACAEDDGEGLASEMAATQIHVLLRAPRRFDHPSWIPRQNLSASLDNYLTDFLVESGLTPASSETTTKRRTKTNKVQGVWVKSRTSSTEAGLENSKEDLAEEDELIWWSWDGKLAGFTGW